jgi:hypothetical protein
MSKSFLVLFCKKEQRFLCRDGPGMLAPAGE